MKRPKEHPNLLTLAEEPGEHVLSINGLAICILMKLSLLEVHS